MEALINNAKKLIAFHAPTRSLPGDDITKYAKLYYASQEDKYSALVMSIKLGDDLPSLAYVYGSFDSKLLGESFNFPPTESVTPSIDLSIQQMSAFKGDEAGKSYFDAPNAPPKCDSFNYCIMVMNITDGKFVLKPKGWKTGNAIPYTLDISTMKSLDITDLQNITTWCLPPPSKTSVKLTHEQTNMLWFGIVISVIVLILALMFYFQWKNKKY